jgi:FixJ family two-component response regulator
VERALESNGVRGEWLGIEITESVLMNDFDVCSRKIRDLQQLGVSISIDDFGTGYSSLSYLCRLPIDVVKIDRSLVPDVMASTQDVSVTRGIINMAHALQMQVLAEGVETEGQLGLLVANGCDLIQGYCFSRPVGADEVERMVREERRLPERLVSRAARTRTLLLVDDEENVIASLKRLFRREGYRLLVALSAAEGLQRLAESNVDVIVSDQRMPGMTGVEFLRRAKELYPDTVRLVLSGYTDLQSIIDAVNEGSIYKFLTKPWDDDRLRAHVAEAFRHKEMADENRRLAREVESANSSLAELNDRLQQTLVRQHDYARLLESSANSSSEILDSVPATIIGVDPEGLIVFVNGDALALPPELSGMIGRPATEALPPTIMELLSDSNSSGHRVQIGDRAYYATGRAFCHAGTDRGRLLVLLPGELDSTE